MRFLGRVWERNLPDPAIVFRTAPHAPLAFLPAARILPVIRKENFAIVQVMPADRARDVAVYSLSEIHDPRSIGRSGDLPDQPFQRQFSRRRDVGIRCARHVWTDSYNP
jgi:hypothetical protein